MLKYFLSGYINGHLYILQAGVFSLAEVPKAYAQLLCHTPTLASPVNALVLRVTRVIYTAQIDAITLLWCCSSHNLPKLGSVNHQALYLATSDTIE